MMGLEYATVTEVVKSHPTMARPNTGHMEGLDRLLAGSLESIIRENLGDRTVQKIEERLFEKYGISFAQSLGQFKKLDAVLREFFGAGADGLEMQFLKTVCEIKSINDEIWLNIGRSDIVKIILESFGDDDKKKILTTLNEEAMITSEIINSCGIPQTSGYRKVNSLIDAGLLVQAGHAITHDGKKVTKYKSIFDNIRIDIVQNKISVALHLRKGLEIGTILTAYLKHL
jgi:hypothetical protein